MPTFLIIKLKLNRYTCQESLSTTTTVAAYNMTPSSIAVEMKRLSIEKRVLIPSEFTPYQPWKPLGRS